MDNNGTTGEDDTQFATLSDQQEYLDLGDNGEVDASSIADNPPLINLDNSLTSNVDNPPTSDVDDLPTSNVDNPPISGSTLHVRQNKIYVCSALIFVLSPLVLAAFMGVKSSFDFFEPPTTLPQTIRLSLEPSISPTTSTSPSIQLTSIPSFQPTKIPTLAPSFPRMSFDIEMINEPDTYGLYDFDYFNETQNGSDASLYFLISGGKKVFVDINEDDCLTDLSDKILAVTHIVGPTAEDKVNVFHGMFFYMNYTEARKSHIWNETERLIKFCLRLDMTCPSCDLNGDGIKSSVGDSVVFRNTIISWKVSNDTVNKYNMNG